jgi:hypothetical protein
MQKISQFTTIKPKQNINKSDDKSMQTVSNTSVIDKIEERAHELCAQNRKLSRILGEKEAEAAER